MTDDLITSLRALAAAQHDDLSIAFDAAIEIENFRAENKRLRAEVERLREALIEWDALIQHRYSGSREAMTDMQYAALRTKRILDELDTPKALEAKP